MKKYVYLAGPIAGCTEEEATEWRNYVCTWFQHGIVGISPLRCEPLKEGMTYTEEGATDKMWSDPRAIATKNWLDTESCDLVLAYLPKELNERRPSYGTVIEIGWAIDDKYLMDHPLIKHNASWRLGNLEDAAEVINGLFGEYVGPIMH